MSVRFGALIAVHQVSLSVARGEIVAIIGPNGAGKTTLLNAVSGFYRPYEGTIAFEGRDRTRLAPPDVAALGIARTFQNVALFKGMSVLDNIMTGRLLKMRGSFLLEALYWGPAQRQELEHRAVVERIIDFLEIQAIRKDAGGPAALRPAEARRARPGARRRAQAPAARRAHGGDERRGEGRHVPLHPRRQSGVRHDHRAHRARHGRGHGHLRPGGGASTTAGRSPTARPPQVRQRRRRSWTRTWESRMTREQRGRRA